MSATYQSLRDRQVGTFFPFDSLTRILLTIAASIGRILNLNHASTTDTDPQNENASVNGLTPKSVPILNEDGEPIWKVLVFDNLGRDVISSVLRVSDLRGWGVTIHLYVYVCRDARQSAC